MNLSGIAEFSSIVDASGRLEKLAKACSSMAKPHEGSSMRKVSSALCIESAWAGINSY